MSNANAATDEKKYLQRLKTLNQAEKSAASAIDRANVKAEAIVAEAGKLREEATKLNAAAKAKLAAAQAAEDDVTAATRAASVETQEANKLVNKLSKDEDKLNEKRAVLARDMAAFDATKEATKDRVRAFEAGIKAACDAVLK